MELKLIILLFVFFINFNLYASSCWRESLAQNPDYQQIFLNADMGDGEQRRADADFARYDWMCEQCRDVDDPQNCMIQKREQLFSGESQAINNLVNEKVREAFQRGLRGDINELSPLQIGQMSQRVSDAAVRICATQLNQLYSAQDIQENITQTLNGLKRETFGNRNNTTNDLETCMGQVICGHDGGTDVGDLTRWRTRVSNAQGALRTVLQNCERSMGLATRSHQAFRPMIANPALELRRYVALANMGEDLNFVRSDGEVARIRPNYDPTLARIGQNSRSHRPVQPVGTQAEVSRGEEEISSELSFGAVPVCSQYQDTQSLREAYISFQCHRGTSSENIEVVLNRTSGMESFNELRSTLLSGLGRRNHFREKIRSLLLNNLLKSFEQRALSMIPTRPEDCQSEEQMERIKDNYQNRYLGLMAQAGGYEGSSRGENLNLCFQSMGFERNQITTFVNELSDKASQIHCGQFSGTTARSCGQGQENFASNLAENQRQGRASYLRHLRRQSETLKDIDFLMGALVDGRQARGDCRRIFNGNASSESLRRCRGQEARGGVAERALLSIHAQSVQSILNCEQEERQTGRWPQGGGQCLLRIVRDASGNIDFSRSNASQDVILMYERFHRLNDLKNRILAENPELAMVADRDENYLARPWDGNDPFGLRHTARTAYLYRSLATDDRAALQQVDDASTRLLQSSMRPLGGLCNGGTRISDFSGVNRGLNHLIDQVLRSNSPLIAQILNDVPMEEKNAHIQLYCFERERADTSPDMASAYYATGALLALTIGGVIVTGGMSLPLMLAGTLGGVGINGLEALATRNYQQQTEGLFAQCALNFDNFREGMRNREESYTNALVLSAVDGLMMGVDGLEIAARGRNTRLLTEAADLFLGRGENIGRRELTRLERSLASGAQGTQEAVSLARRELSTSELAELNAFLRRRNINLQLPPQMREAVSEILSKLRRLREGRNTSALREADRLEDEMAQALQQSCT